MRNLIFVLLLLFSIASALDSGYQESAGLAAHVLFRESMIGSHGLPQCYHKLLNCKSYHI